MGTSIAKIFDMTIASTGLNEKILIASGKKYKEDYFVSIVHPMSHAGYYPGSLPMTIKLIFANDKKILGVQIAGYDGVDKRIDTIATTIFFGGDIYDLSRLELAYAPPYSSAKDPVNFAGFVATNIYEKLTNPIRWQEYIENKEEYILLDVREDMEAAAGFIDNSINIPLTKLRERIGELNKNKNYLVYCAVGIRGYIAERILKQNGINASNLLGGYRTYAELNSDKLTSVHQIADTNQEKFVKEKSDFPEKIEILDVCGLSCPGPIMQVSRYIEEIEIGDVVKVLSTDPGFIRDIGSWCKSTGNTLLNQATEGKTFTATIQKGLKNFMEKEINATNKKEKTMIVFSGDLDRAIASFIIANGAAAMGNKVNMFFTFWGLNILRKNEYVATKKNIVEKMFSIMMPRGSSKLKLSKMNFAGVGSKMIKNVMKKNNVLSLEDLIKEAVKNGVKLSACQMSMDLMGIKREEFIDGVEVVGVASMLEDNDNGNMNLFI